MREHFLKLKQNLELNDSFDDTVKTRHAAIRSAIANRNQEIKDTKLIGSLQKQTRIQPRADDTFDIDILVIMGEFTAWVPVGDPRGVLPDAAIHTLHTTVTSSDRYAAKDPQKDAPTVSLTFDSGPKVELVPAYLDMIGHSADGTVHSPKGRAYWIPKNGVWELADYDHEAAYLSAQNIASKYWLVPVLKMLKAIKRIHFPEFDSFPMEIIAAHVIPIAVSMREMTNQEIFYPELISDFFRFGKDHLSNPLKVPGSNSPAVVHHLPISTALVGKFNQILNHIGRISSFTTQNERITAWRALFGDVFPVTI